jgi:hypothetical protein
VAAAAAAARGSKSAPLRWHYPVSTLLLLCHRVSPLSSPFILMCALPHTLCTAFCLPVQGWLACAQLVLPPAVDCTRPLYLPLYPSTAVILVLVLQHPADLLWQARGAQSSRVPAGTVCRRRRQPLPLPYGGFLRPLITSRMPAEEPQAIRAGFSETYLLLPPSLGGPHSGHQAKSHDWATLLLHPPLPPWHIPFPLSPAFVCGWQNVSLPSLPAPHTSRCAGTAAARPPTPAAAASLRLARRYVWRAVRRGPV